MRCSEVLEGHEEVQDRCTLTETDERFGFSADDIIDHITNYKDDGDRCPFWTFHCSVHHSPGYLQYIERHNRSNNGGLPTFIRDLLRSIIRAQYPNHPLTLKSNTLASKLFDSSCFEYLDLLIQNLDRTTLDTSWDLTGCVRSLEKASINRKLSWQSMAGILIPDNYKTNTKRGLYLQAAMAEAGFDVTNLSSLMPRTSGVKSAKFRRRRKTIRIAGGAKLKAPYYPPASSVISNTKEMLKKTPELSALIIGSTTPRREVLVKRWVKTPSGYELREFSRSLFGRYISLRDAVTSLLESLRKVDLLPRDLARFNISTWADGSDIGSFPTVLGRWRTCLTENLLLGEREEWESQAQKILQVQSWLTLPMAESREELESVLMVLFNDQVAELEADPLLVSGFDGPITVFCALFIADNKMLHIICGVCGGLSPCPCCYAAKMNFHVYKESCNQVSRTLLRTVERLHTLEKDQLPLGDSYIPLLCRPDGSLASKSILVGLDGLHIVLNSGLATLEKTASRFSGSELLEANFGLFARQLQFKWVNGRPSFANATGSNLRLAYMAIDNIFSTQVCELSDVEAAKVLAPVRHFRNIILLLYSSIADRSTLLTCTLYVETFLYHKSVEREFPFSTHSTGLYGLPFHELVAHLPFLSRLFPMENLNTEAFEREFKDLRTTKRLQCNHKEDIIGQILLRLRLNKIVPPNRVGRVAQLTIKSSFQRLRKPIIIPMAMITDEDGGYSSDFKCLLTQIGDFFLDDWYVLGEENVTFFPFLTEADSPPPVLPVQVDFTTITPEALIQKIGQRFAENPIHAVITDFSGVKQKKSHELVDSLNSYAIDFSAANGDYLKQAISVRRSHTSCYDQRCQHLVTRIEDLSQIPAKMRNLSVAMMRERLAEDNHILKSRYEGGHAVPAKNATKREWQEFLAKEATTLKRSRQTETGFSSFEPIRQKKKRK